MASIRFNSFMFWATCTAIVTTSTAMMRFFVMAETYTKPAPGLIIIACPNYKHPNRCLIARRTVSAGVCADCLKHDRQGRHLIRPPQDPATAAAIALAHGDASPSNRKGGCAGCS